MTQSDDNEINFVFERLSLDPEPNDKSKLKFTIRKKVFEAIDILKNKKKKRPDTKSIYELIKKNYNISISESEMENVTDEMINKKLIYNNKTDQGLDSLYKNTKIDDETSLDLSYLSESKNSNNFEEDAFCILSQILSQQFIPQATDLETPLDKTEVITRGKITNENFAVKFEAKMSAIKNYVEFEFSEVNKKINSVSENMNQLSKMFDIIKKDRSLVLNGIIEFLKNKLKSKDEMIKSLIETQTLVLETVKNSKANPTITQDEIGKNRSVEENPNKHKNFGKKTLIVKNLAPSVVLEDITELLGLNSTKYLRENYIIELPLNLQETNNKGYVYVTAPNHIADELVKLNGIELRGHHLIIEEAAAKAKTLNSNTINFTSPNRYAVLAPNQEEKEDNFEIIRTSNFDIFKNVRNDINKRNAVNNPQSPKRRSQVVVNKHPENQTSFRKSNVKPDHKTYSEATMSNKEKYNILIFSDSFPGKLRMYEFNKVLKNKNVKHLFFSRCNIRTSITVFRRKLANTRS